MPTSMRTRTLNRILHSVVAGSAACGGVLDEIPNDASVRDRLETDVIAEAASFDAGALDAGALDAHTCKVSGSSCDSGSCCALCAKWSVYTDCPAPNPAPGAGCEKLCGCPQSLGWVGCSPSDAGVIACAYGCPPGRGTEGI